MFKEIQGAYDNIYSLGFNCQIAYQLKINYIRFCSGPFDWYLTNNISIIRKNMNNRFKEFFLPENMMLIEGTPKDKYYVYKDKVTGYICPHDIYTNKNQEEQLIQLYKKFRRRTDRLFESVHKSKKNLFIRIIFGEKENILELDDALKQEFGNNYKLIGIKVKGVSKVSLYKLNEHTFLCEMDTNTICLNKNDEWKGNINNWEQLLSGIYYNKSDLKYKYFKKREENLNKVKLNIGNRELVIWGSGNELFVLEHILKKTEITISKIYDSEEKNRQEFSSELLLNIMDLNPKKFYVIVTQLDLDKTIKNKLMEKKYIEGKDYIDFFKEENNYMKSTFD